MITGDLFQGELVRLSAVAPDAGAQQWARWQRHTAFQRYLDDTPAMLWSVKKMQEWGEKEAGEEAGREIRFDILTGADDRLIGFVELFINSWSHAEAWVGIGIGDREDWSKGYGTDAMRLALRYAFTELNLHRVSLGVFAYNPRAMRSYEKAGFRYEGRQRSVLHRDGEWADVIYMGILRSEWMAAQAPQAGQPAASGG